MRKPGWLSMGDEDRQQKWIDPSFDEKCLKCVWGMYADTPFHLTFSTTIKDRLFLLWNENVSIHPDIVSHTHTLQRTHIRMKALHISQRGLVEKASLCLFPRLSLSSCHHLPGGVRQCLGWKTTVLMYRPSSLRRVLFKMVSSEKCYWASENKEQSIWIERPVMHPGTHAWFHILSCRPDFVCKWTGLR